MARVSQLSNSIKLIVLYDSLNPLHVEWLQNQERSTDEELWVNVSDESRAELVEDLSDLCDIDPEKVSAKNRPTFICKTGNRLTKMKLSSETERQSL